MVWIITKNVEEIFKYINILVDTGRGVVVFIDEIDSILAQRQPECGCGSTSASNDIVNSCVTALNKGSSKRLVIQVLIDMKY